MACRRCRLDRYALQEFADPSAATFGSSVNSPPTVIATPARCTATRTPPNSTTARRARPRKVHTGVSTPVCSTASTSGFAPPPYSQETSSGLSAVFTALDAAWIEEMVVESIADNLRRPAVSGARRGGIVDQAPARAGRHRGGLIDVAGSSS